MDAALDQLSKRFENSIRHKLYNDTGLDFVWSLEPIAERVSTLMICWSYGYRGFIALGKAVLHHRVMRFEPLCNHPSEMLKDRIKSFLATQPSPTDVAKLTVYCAELRWDQIKHPVVEIDTLRSCSIKPSN